MKPYEFPEKTSILIVDDSLIHIHYLTNLFKHDYHILAATNGPQALEMAAGGQPPHVILLDVEMPEIDGYEVCRRLKANSQTKNIPVIFITPQFFTEDDFGKAQFDATDEEMGFRLGAVDFISKPFHPAIVRARVKNHMRLKLKTDMLEMLSLQDGLTDIPNRRYFDERLAVEWESAVRYGMPLSMVMMDMDHLKLYNDHYGHGAGDDCLRRVAKTLKKSIPRPIDLVARYGDGKFAVLLTDTDAKGALKMAEQLRAAVEALAIKHAYSKPALVVTLSVGVATHASESAKTDMHQLQYSAEQALCRAKEQGRNQVQAE